MPEGMSLEERREYRHQYYLDHRTEQIEYAKQYNRLHKVIRTAHYWEYRAQLKSEILTHYGNGKLACIKCGFNDIRALSIDHINGNGGRHRRDVGVTTGGRPFYVWLRTNDFPKGFQTLCMNCQYIKRSEEKEYRTGNGIRFTAPRDHESYVVDAGKKTYYPLVKYLNSVASDIERIHG